MASPKGSPSPPNPPPAPHTPARSLKPALEVLNGEALTEPSELVDFFIEVGRQTMGTDEMVRLFKPYAFAVLDPILDRLKNAEQLNEGTTEQIRSFAEEMAQYLVGKGLHAFLVKWQEVASGIDGNGDKEVVAQLFNHFAFWEIR